MRNIQLFGKDTSTEILGNREKPILTISDCENVRITGIAFRHTGEAGQPPSPVVRIRDSRNVELDLCFVSGSMKQAGIEIIGASRVFLNALHSVYNRIGLSIDSLLPVEVSECTFKQNSQYGIEVGASSQAVTLVHNRCKWNGNVGIIYRGIGKAVIENNDCRENSYYGIVIEKKGSEIKLMHNPSKAGRVYWRRL